MSRSVTYIYAYLHLWAYEVAKYIELLLCSNKMFWICTVSSWTSLRKHLNTTLKQVWAKMRSNFANVLFQPIRDNLERFMLKSEFVQWLFRYLMTTGKIQKLFHFIHLFIYLKLEQRAWLELLGVGSPYTFDIVM